MPTTKTSDLDQPGAARTGMVKEVAATANKALIIACIALILGVIALIAAIVALV